MTGPRTTGPGAPAGKRAKPAKPVPPKRVDLARWLFILAAVVGMARFVVQLGDREMLIGELRARQPGLGQDELDAAATGGIVFGLLLVAGVLLLYVLLANRVAAGRNWARIVLTLLAAGGAFLGIVRLLAVVTGVATAFGLAVNPVDLAFGVVTMIIDAVAVVLVFSPSVSGHFRSVRSVSAKPPQVANGL
ncbi:hypothetical protein [Saccharothrix yanglingensis]|uniref:Uncharacterized protein n=1 Tax=Saccharothrix yanglingensis TaxID=659496 RepID=A0ABU0WT40_9PSEU|nr:hypothetical protein [Saccharothrix yanglingensis]MDQ2582693.1 hypothetical protein [Saccharothrix yanglingensis]